MPAPQPIEGAPTTLEAQDTVLFALQSAASGNGNGNVAPSDGFNGAQMVELDNPGTGGCTVNLEGSFDGVSWYGLGYQQVDGIGNTLARTASAIAVTAGPFAHVYQVLDAYPQVRARISGAAAGLALTARIYMVPL